MKKLLVLLMLMTMSLPATAAAYKNGNQLLANCESSGYYDLATCLGYIMGVSDTSEGKTWDGRTYCEPPEVKSGQLQMIVIKHLNEHPEERHYVAYALVQNALFKAFPCPPNKVEN